MRKRPLFRSKKFQQRLHLPSRRMSWRRTTLGPLSERNELPTLKGQSPILGEKQALKKLQKTPMKNKNLNPKKVEDQIRPKGTGSCKRKSSREQSNLDFLVKNSQASKYLLSVDEEKKEREKAFHQLKK